ncbi:hypothetical protein C4D60_Mb10t23630 [Musa balbisiana]|uniref:Uncharacterized protein n=1 Tax=Musa balbisiana TaxID=52838 RepID=A0A4S8IZC7_MUSBA|nr:hypothetical protein C4D60_Mb10t23630 [Musa balbisiana]
MMLYSSSDRSLCWREEAGQGDRTGQVEGRGQQHHRERRTKDQREQAPLQEEQLMMLYSSSDRSLCWREEAGQGDRTGQVEGRGQQHHRERRTKDQREQAPLQEEQYALIGLQLLEPNEFMVSTSRRGFKEKWTGWTKVVYRCVCAMCGKQVLDTKLYKQSNV